AGGLHQSQRPGLLPPAAERGAHHPDPARHAAGPARADQRRRRDRDRLRPRLSPLLAPGGRAMTLPFTPREEIARLCARMLLEIKAVHFNADEPFTLASGLPSPTYIDCRKLISFPRIRTT